MLNTVKDLLEQRGMKQREIKEILTAHKIDFFKLRIDEMIENEKDGKRYN